MCVCVSLSVCVCVVCVSASVSASVSVSAWKVFPQLLDPGCLPPWLHWRFRMTNITQHVYSPSPSPVPDHDESIPEASKTTSMSRN